MSRLDEVVELPGQPSEIRVKRPAAGSTSLPGMSRGLRARAAGKADALGEWLTGNWTDKAFYLLIAADILFIALHLLLRDTNLVSDPRFSLGRDQGYAELFQYLKLLAIVPVLAAAAVRRRSPVYFHWVLLFSYLVLDDAFQIHELLGKWVSDELGLPALLNLRPRDLGELAVAAGAGLFFLTTLSVTYQRSGRRARATSQNLILLLAALVFCGVIADMAHTMARSGVWRTILGVVEDGGENLVMSVIAWYVLAHVTPQGAAARVRLKRQALAWARVAVEGAVLGAIFIALLGVVQFGSSALAGNDGYYHAKMGLLIRQQGLKTDPPQLPLTILNEADFYDHHLLYHVYLSLFAAVDPAEDGGVALTQRVKFASILLPAAAFMAVWWLMRRNGVRWAFLWSLGLLAVSEAFLYRMSMPRAQAASLLVLVLGLHWLLQARYRWLLPLGFAYVWLYNAFPLLFLLAGAYFAAVALKERRWVWPALGYPAAGIALGLVVNLYFPQDVTFIIQHWAPKVLGSTTQVGNEWYPYEIGTLLWNSGFAVGVFLLGVLALGRQRGRISTAALTTLLVTAVFGLMLLRSRRFVEYFPPFALLFTAFTTAPLLDAWLQKRPRLCLWLPAGLALLLAGPLVITVNAARDSMARSAPANQYAAAALWLKVYSDPGSVVFQTDWDDFTRLFFYDSDKVYTVGLDPTYLELRDPGLYAEWVQITRGEVARPSTPIRDRFGGEYVFTDVSHESFLQQAAEDPGLREIYHDAGAVIFKVVGTPDD